MIQEIIVTTQNEDNTTHIAPMGIRQEAGFTIISPFKPSQSLTNIQRNQCAVVNRIDDVRIFAGCLTGHYHWPLAPTEHIGGQRLAQALSHVELKLHAITQDKLRPRCYLKAIYEANHLPFKGFNRAQAAVLEATILVSRLHLLPLADIKQQLAYLTIAIEKTASDNERLAWRWLQDKIAAFEQQEDTIT